MIFLEHKVAPKVLKYMVFVLDLVGEFNKKQDVLYLYSQKSCQPEWIWTAADQGWMARNLRS